MKSTKNPGSTRDGIEKYFPALGTLVRIFVAGLRVSGLVFGGIFAGAPAYLIWKYVWPVLADPSRAAGEKWGAGAFGVFGLGFVVAGLFVIREALFRTSLPTPRRTPPSLPDRREMLERAREARRRNILGMRKRPGGGVVISSAHLYRAVAIIVGIFGTFWNGITFAALADTRGGGVWFSVIHTLLLLPFLTVGVGLFYVFVKILLSLRQPVVEIHLPKETYSRGETVRAEIYLKDPARMAKSLRVVLRKRYLRPEDEGTGLTHDSWIVEEKTLLERGRDELDGAWSDSVTVSLPALSIDEPHEEWSEWSLETVIETGLALPLYLAAPLPYELREE